MLRVMRNVVKAVKPPLVTVSHQYELKFISSHTDFQDGSNDTTFDLPSVPLDSTFKLYRYRKF